MRSMFSRLSVLKVSRMLKLFIMVTHDFAGNEESPVPLPGINNGIVMINDNALKSFNFTFYKICHHHHRLQLSN